MHDHTQHTVRKDNLMKTKRLLAALLSSAMLAGTLPTALAAEPKAATRGEVCAALIQAADDYNPTVTKSDIMHGDPDGDLREQAPVTRAEALVMLQRAFGTLPAPVGDNARKAYPSANFTDIPNWAKDELQNVFDAGIVAGTSATTFSPEEFVTMEQMNKFIRRTYALFGTNEKDDFYATVNKSWLDSSTIKPGYTSNGTLNEMMTNTEPLTELIEQAAKNPTNEDARRIAALYNNFLDYDARDALGIEPIKPYLTALDNAKTLSDLMDVQQKLSDEVGGSLLLTFSLTTDMKDSNRYTVALSGPGVSLTKEIYAADSGSQKDAYIAYVQKLFTLGGYDEATAKENASLVWQFEKALAPHMLDRQDYSNVDKIYNPYTMDQLRALFPHVDLDKVYAQSGLTKSDQIIVIDPGLLKAQSAYFDDAHVPMLKAYTQLVVISSFGSYLGRAFEDAANEYQQAFLGISGTLSDKERATNIVMALLSDELGRLYVEKYFSAEAKADVTDMVRDFISIYEERIKKIDWMSDTTKQKAIAKLDTMGIKVGYPDEGQWNDLLKDVTLKSKADGGSYFDNMLTIQKAQKKLLQSWQSKPVNKGLWAMSVFTVNACYVPQNNEIVFPAGILQAPMYDVKAPREKNLGAIGYVIAHEITHAFDNNGAKFDENGNAADWWTSADYAAFQKLCEKAISYYDGVESAPGIVCNGTLTLSENIADLGAAACILETAKREKAPDLALLFRTMAETWASTATREYEQYAATIDVHAPAKLRGSRVLQSMDDFYTTFDIKEGDGMWLAPENRVRIW